MYEVQTTNYIVFKELQSVYTHYNSYYVVYNITLLFCQNRKLV